MTSQTWILAPRDPAVIGDGRSIGATTMNRSLDLPWPGSVAGLFRTRQGQNVHGVFTGDPEALRADVTLKGPLLVALDRLGNADATRILVPALADAVVIEPSGDVPAQSAVLRALAPLAGASGTTSLPAGLGLVGMDGAPTLAKPSKNADRYWRWSSFESWLTRSASERDGLTAFTDGVPSLPREKRRHVVVRPDTKTVEDGKLFMTEGVRYSWVANGQVQPLALLVRVDGATDVNAGVVGLGGEKRVTFLSSSNVALPGLPSAVASKVGTAKVARVVLLTHAFFDEGAYPHAINGAPVIAAKVDRPVFVSGWDFKSNQPKASRRAAPAGSVYWVDLNGISDVTAWLSQTWMSNISSDAQDRRDGYGLAAVGVM